METSKSTANRADLILRFQWTVGGWARVGASLTGGHSPILCAPIYLATILVAPFFLVLGTTCNALVPR
jgi:hypothetical protein